MKSISERAVALIGLIEKPQYYWNGMKYSMLVRNNSGKPL